MTVVQFILLLQLIFIFTLMNDFSTRESIEQFIIDNANSDAYLPHIASKSDALFRHFTSR